MFAKSDKTFAALVDDPKRRHAAIVNLKTRRTFLFWCALASALASFAASFGDIRGGIAVAISSPILWILLFKFDSDLKLLLMFDRLKQNDV